MRGVQLAQPLLVGASRMLVDGHESLEHGQPARAPRRHLDLAVMEEGIAGVHQPAVAVRDDDAGVTARVPLQGDEEDSSDRLDGLEAHPGLAARAVHSPARTVRPLRRPVAPLLGEAMGVHSRLMLDIENVHDGVREVAHATRMVEVEVRQDQVAHVGRGEAEAADLRKRCLGLIERGAHAHQEQATEALDRTGDIARAQPRVDEDEAVIGLDEQAVADEPGSPQQAGMPVHEPAAGGTHRPAVEVVDPHPRMVTDGCAACDGYVWLLRPPLREDSP